MAKGTDKGGARKGKMAGSRLAFDDTKQEKMKMKTTKKRTLPKSLIQWQEAVRHVKDKHGHDGAVRKGTKIYAAAKKLHAEMMKK
tara:strand:+ start:84 stop:338 length:255 start_codon:yes stop_codon:yes gene_type:complete